MSNSPRLLLSTALLAALAACSGQEPASPSTGADAAAPQARTALGRQVAEALDEARTELANENITIGDDSSITVNGASFGTKQARDAQGNPLPKAELTPTGDLLIEGKAVALTPAQRQLVLAYRNELLGVIGAGMALGAQGADLGVTAATEALKGVFSGGPGKEFEQRMEAEAEKMKAEAGKICQRLPGLMRAQASAAAAVPAFAPYATMTQADIDECVRENETSGSGQAGDATRAQVREAIRENIRDNVRAVVRADDTASSPAEQAAPDAAPAR